MRYTLIIMWIVILAGLAVIGTKLLNPAPPQPDTLSETPPETVIDIQTPISPLERALPSSKNLPEYISRGNPSLKIVQTKLNMRQIEDAHALLQTLPQEEPAVQYFQGIFKILAKDFDKSREHFTALAKNPQISGELKSHAQTFLTAFETFATFREGKKIHLQTMLAQALSQTGQYEAAIPLLFDVIQQKNNYRDAWIVLGYAYLKSEKIPDAIDALLQAKKLDHQKPETLFYLGMAYAYKGEVSEAILYLKKADEAGYPHKDIVQMKLGDLYLLLQKYESAAMHYENLLATHSEHLEIFVRTAWLYLEKTNTPEKAVLVAENALKAHPGSAMSFNLMGWSYLGVKRYAEAEAYLKKALELQPGFDAAYYNLGQLKEEKGEVREALQYYEKAASSGQGNAIGTLATKRSSYLKADSTSPAAP